MGLCAALYYISMIIIWGKYVLNHMFYLLVSLSQRMYWGHGCFSSWHFQNIYSKFCLQYFISYKLVSIVEVKIMIIVVFQKEKKKELMFLRQDFVYTIHICSPELFFTKIILLLSYT